MAETTTTCRPSDQDSGMRDSNVRHSLEELKVPPCIRPPMVAHDDAPTPSITPAPTGEMYFTTQGVELSGEITQDDHRGSSSLGDEETATRHPQESQDVGTGIITTSSSSPLTSGRIDGDAANGGGHSGGGENDSASLSYISFPFSFAEDAQGSGHDSLSASVEIMSAGGLSSHACCISIGSSEDGQAQDDADDSLPPPMEDMSAGDLSSPASNISMRSSKDHEKPRWQGPCRGRLPGATPLQGAILRSLEEIDSAISFGFEREKRDHLGVSNARAHRHLVGWQRRALVRQIDHLSKTTLRYPSGYAEYMSCDTVSLAVMTLLRFLGSTAEKEPLSDNELLWLPAACVSTAYKIEDNGADTLDEENRQTIVHLLVDAMEIPNEEKPEAKKQIVDLEFKMLFSLDLRLTTATAMFFLHHILERAVVAGTLKQEDASVVGACAMEVASPLITDDRTLCDYTPSEVAGAAVYCGMVHVYGFHKAVSVVGAVAGFRGESPGFEKLVKFLGFPTEQQSGDGVSIANSDENSDRDDIGGSIAMEGPTTRRGSGSSGALSTCADETNSDDQPLNESVDLVAGSSDACSPASSTHGDGAWQLQAVVNASDAEDDGYRVKVEDEMIQNVEEKETVSPSDSACSMSTTSKEGGPLAQGEETTCWSIVTNMREELSTFVEDVWDELTEGSALTACNSTASTRPTAGHRQKGWRFGDVLQGFFFPSPSQPQEQQREEEEELVYPPFDSCIVAVDTSVPMPMSE